MFLKSFELLDGQTLMIQRVSNKLLALKKTLTLERFKVREPKVFPMKMTMYKMFH